jgi:putative addiction module component (TIGR02574 family)
MRDAPPLPPPGFDDLSVEEQIEYVSSLWDRIASQPEAVPVPDWHWKIIEERLAAHEAAPDSALTMEEVRRSITQLAQEEEQ